MPALHDAKRQAVDVDRCSPGHDGSLAEIEPGPVFYFRRRRSHNITKKKKEKEKGPGSIQEFLNGQFAQ
jgi:hypothetical protein